MMRFKIYTFKLIAVFLFFVSFGASSQVTRQPYLQVCTPTSIIIRWQTGTGVIGKVYYGSSVSSLTQSVDESKDKRIYHEVKLSGLTSNEKYYYSVDGPSKASEDQYFITSPGKGSNVPARIWVISDFGQTNSSQNDRRLETVARWRSFNNDNYHASFILSLGDQTEDDAVYQIQHNYFSQLENVLKNSPLYTVVGNHETHDSLYNYLRTFTLPAKAEAGGIASNSEKYYSFNYSNVHVVVLCTETDDDKEYRSQIDWLKKDLSNNKEKWLIACMHQPFHSGGYHPTDEEGSAQKRRTDWLTVLEDNGVDIVLQGHNHVYERSYMVDNLIGRSPTLTKANKIDTGSGQPDKGGPYRKAPGRHKGTIFISCAAGGDANSAKHYPVPFNIFPIAFPGSDYEGSVVIDVNNNQMDVKFICDEKNKEGSYIWDYFTITKSD